MSIYRDKERGCYVFEFSRRIHGQRVRARRHLPKTWNRTQADAFDRKESERLYAIASGIARRQYTIEDAVAAYLKDKKHLKSYKSTAEHLAATVWAYHGKPIESLPEVAERIVEECASWKPATIRNRIAYLRAACRWGWKKHGMAESDPAERLVVPSVHNERHVYVELIDLYRILHHVRNREARRVIVAAYYTGMRLSEILRSEIDGDSLTVMNLKNGEAIKSVPMHPALARYIEGRWPPTCSPKTVQKWARIGMDKAGLPNVHFHDLRHSTASALINAGASLYIVGQILGHKDPRSTQRYAHLKNEIKRAALERIGSNLGG